MFATSMRFKESRAGSWGLTGRFGLTRLCRPLAALLLISATVTSCSSTAPRCAANGPATCTTGNCPSDASAPAEADAEVDTAANADADADDDAATDHAEPPGDGGADGDTEAGAEPTADGGADGDDGAPVSTLTIDFTEPGARVLAGQWLIFQPAQSGSLDVTTDIGSSWATHPRAVQAQSLSLCGDALKEDESSRSLDATGFPDSSNGGLANLRSVQVSELGAATFCAGVHHASGAWTFIHAPVQPTVDAASGLAIGTLTLSEDDVDLVAVLFEQDSFVRAVEYRTSP